MPNYNVRIQHDTGVVRIKTYAKDRDTAIDLVVAAEGCPRSAVLSANADGGRWIHAKHIPYKSPLTPAINFHNQGMQ